MGEALTAGLAPPVTYVATTVAVDAEMTERVAAHRARRPASWSTVEVGRGEDLGAVLRPLSGSALVDSLGAWLAGLVASHDPRAAFAVLLTPIARLDRAIAELAFCAPIRQGLQNRAIRFDALNLRAHFPVAGPENILLIESTHDLFAPADTVEELWRAWRKPEIWRLPHGHISVLLSLPIMERAVDWVVRHAATRA